jgi:hypothetical protein
MKRGGLDGKRLQLAGDSVGAVLACRAFNPQVIFADGGQFQIDAGSASGVQVGDEWVLVNGQQIPQRSLDAGVIAQTVLARVSSVSEGSARLQWLAGPQKAVQTQWQSVLCFNLLKLHQSRCATISMNMELMLGPVNNV